MTPKQELANDLSARGIRLPDNWAKMSFDRAERWAKTELAKNAKTEPKTEKKQNRLAKALASFGSKVRGEQVRDLSYREREKKSWAKRRMEAALLKQKCRRPAQPPIHKGRSGACVSKLWFIQSLAGSNAAEDPNPMTRQVRRQNERRHDKLMLADLKKNPDGRKGGAAAITMKDVAVVKAASGYNAHA